MKNSAIVKSKLLDALAAVVDEPLKEAGFVRNRGSLTYQRVLEAADQRIAFVTDFFPKCQPGVEAHIHPLIQLRMSHVSEKALFLVNGDRMLLADAPEIIVNQPIEFVAPKEQHQRWFASGKDECLSACAAILAFLNRWVLPFLSEVSRPADLVNLYERNDPRILKQKQWYIFIAAAYEIVGQHHKARQVVQEEFKGAGLGRRYASLLASFAVD